MTMDAKFLEPVSGRDLGNYVARFKVSKIEELDGYMEALYWSLTLIKNSEARATMAKMKNILAALTADLRANVSLSANVAQNLGKHSTTARRTLGLLAFFCDWLEIRMDECFEMVCRLEAIVLQWLTFFWLVLGFMSIDNKCFFRIFNGVRYKCTTMPWTIWPALVVLWGVCWMFYGFPTYERELQGAEDATSPWLHGFEGLDNQNPWPGLPDAILTGFDLLLPEQYSNSSDQVLQDSNLQISEFGQQDFSSTPTVNAPVLRTSHVEHGWPLTGLTATNPTPAFELDHRISETPQAVAIINEDTRPMPMATVAACGSQSQASNSQTQNSRRRRIVSCEICNMTFHRTDVLKRHRQEKHETDELLCPHDPCKRSEHGSGFKRQEHLKRHLLSCKVLKSKGTLLPTLNQSEPNQSGTQAGSESERQVTTHSGQEREEGRGEGTKAIGLSGNCDLLNELKKRREAEHAELKKLDQEIESKRQTIACFDQLIKDLEQRSSKVSRRVCPESTSRPKHEGYCVDGVIL